MKSDTSPLFKNYLTALRRHLKSREDDAPLTTARQWGVKAVHAGLQILDLARLHEEALVILALPRGADFNPEGDTRRAGLFFAEAITPIEETHRGALEANLSLQQTVESLRLRTEQLASSNEELKLEIAERAAVELSLRSSEFNSNQLLKKSREQQEELRDLSRRLFMIQEEERRRISRDIHDVIAQTLVGITMRLEALKIQNVTGTKNLQRQIEATQRLVTRSIEIVHRFAWDLRPTVLDDLGLIPALKSYLKGFFEQTGIRVRLTAFASIETINTEVLTALFRITQEALSNVARHAKASEAQISIKKNQGGIRMEIQDNGCGFVIKPDSFPQSGRRLGLLGMRERVTMLGGSFHVESVPGVGTKLLIDLPPHPAKPVNSIR